jgi:CBS domain-containing protein
VSHSTKQHRVHLGARIDAFMQRDVVSISSSATLVDAEILMAQRRISCVLVKDGDEPIGIFSRTDLLRAARDGALGSAIGPLCKRVPIAVPIDATVSLAARRMVDERVHRVFVEEAGRIVGVFSTFDTLRAIVAARVATRLLDVMSRPPFMLRFDAPLIEATARLADAHVSGLTVVDEEGWPLGYYSQPEALAARDMASDARIEDAMNPGLVCLHERAELHRAAALAGAARARRVLVIRDKRAEGVLSPLDFARAVSA